jgi:hypothetical protein
MNPAVAGPEKICEETAAPKDDRELRIDVRFGKGGRTA